MRLQGRFPEVEATDLVTTLRGYAEKIAAYVASQIGTVLRHTAGFAFQLSVTILAMFYLFRDGPSLVDRLREVLPFEGHYRDRMIRDSRDLIFASVTSSIVAAAAHGLLGGVAFGLTGIGAPIFWGVMMGFFSLVPVVGSAFDLGSSLDQPDARRPHPTRHHSRAHLQRHRRNDRQYYSSLAYQRAGGDGWARGFY